MAPPRRRTRPTGMSPGAMGGRIGSGITSVSSRPTTSRNNDRQQRRAQQQKELDQFKQTLKVAPGTTNLYQEQAPQFNPMTGKYERTTLAQKAMELANKYGPTPREVLGDIGSGIGSIAGGLMNKVSSGNFGIMGIAKGLYEQFSNKASQAKNFLGEQVNKLSDIDLEFLKNKEKYSYMSSHPRLQNINQLESDLKQTTQARDNIGKSFGFVDSSQVMREPMETLVPSTLYGMPQQPPGFKVMPEGQQQLLADIRKADQNMMMAQGGSVDNKLNEIQKSTNNIYGTGILSVK